MKQKLTEALMWGWPLIVCALLVILKLAHFITWSWWWVLLPVWLPLAISAIAIVIILAVVRRY